MSGTESNPSTKATGFAKSGTTVREIIEQYLKYLKASGKCAPDVTYGTVRGSTDEEGNVTALVVELSDNTEAVFEFTLAKGDSVKDIIGLTEPVFVDEDVTLQ